MLHIAQTASLISELEIAVQGSSAEQRIGTMRRISDLFLTNADRISEAQVGLFDDVLLHLITRVENRALAELGARLAPVDNAPYSVIQHLARHDDVAVAAPVLSASQQLTDNDLVEIAQSKSQGHLVAISGRAQLGERVTDVLVERGDRDVVHRVATNAGASFSERGFTRLVKRAENDDVLAERVGSRLDIPVPLLRELLQKATATVQKRILESAPIETREDIHRVLASASNEIVREVIAPRDFTQAQELVLRLKQKNQLNEAVIFEFARTRKYEEMVASLALLCSAPINMIERLMQSIRHDGLIVACKAGELKWATVSAVLSNRFAHHAIAPQQLQEAKFDFLKLTVPTAQRVFRFWLVRESTASKAA